ncbi:hypothetical protein BESB_059470 [Besnoitia besnoiti]|uniref:RlmI-like PUA domain-containing protein n=1 Tax=Besnoitia besnoiti TaxID=94643 RepID=A0A2A9MI33_BESBE|nr:hypothetical protein BESB_059470 [Besnoitia besnoiti]PFH35060.1 hypothetical protein BESB_059470 [Besnoitia besnoiti]
MASSPLSQSGARGALWPRLRRADLRRPPAAHAPAPAFNAASPRSLAFPVVVPSSSTLKSACSGAGLQHASLSFPVLSVSPHLCSTSASWTPPSAAVPPRLFSCRLSSLSSTALLPRSSLGSFAVSRSSRAFPSPVPSLSFVRAFARAASRQLSASRSPGPAALKGELGRGNEDAQHSDREDVSAEDPGEEKEGHDDAPTGAPRRAPRRHNEGRKDDPKSQCSEEHSQGRGSHWTKEDEEGDGRVTGTGYIRRDADVGKEDATVAAVSASPFSFLSPQPKRARGKPEKVSKKQKPREKETSAAPAFRFKWNARAALEAGRGEEAAVLSVAKQGERHAHSETETGGEEKAESLMTGAVPQLRLHSATACQGGVKRRERLCHGHPWVYEHEVANLEELRGVPAGTLVEVIEEDGSLVGVGLLNRCSSVPVRFLRHALIYQKQGGGGGMIKSAVPDASSCDPSEATPSASFHSPPATPLASEPPSSPPPAKQLRARLRPTDLLPAPVEELSARLRASLQRQRALALSDPLVTSSAAAPSAAPSSLPVPGGSAAPKDRFSPSALRALKASGRARFSARDQGAGADAPGGSCLRETVFYRAVAGEADGLPGLEIDVFESCVGRESARAQTVQVVRLNSVSARPLLPLVVDICSKELPPATCIAVQSIQSNKEKLAQEGAEFVTELVHGEDPCVWFETRSLPVRAELVTHLLLPPFAAYSPSCQHLQRTCFHLTESLRAQFGARLSLLTVRAGARAIGVISALSAEAEATQTAADRAPEARGRLGAALAGAPEWSAKVENVVLVEEAEALADLASQMARRNGLAEKTTIFTRVDVDVELEKMTRSHLKFHLAYLHFPPAIKFRPSQRHGQFGAGYRPSFRGVSRSLSTSLDLLHPGGVLVYSLLLPKEESRDVGFDLLRAAVQATGKKAVLLGTWGSNSDQRFLVSHNDLWYEHVYCVRLQ